jgi:superfamily II DNA or RNA helicase/HKD family nuclease/diadenosine tetraphosphate (Ap4A) HIT family hydrolase
MVLWDGFPVSPGHALVVPRRHIATWFDATREEQIALLQGIDLAREEILRRHKPDGFNIGINIDAAGGQTVFHLHIHLIPRYAGDLPDPRGGVRNVIPSKGNYLRAAIPGANLVGLPPHHEALIRGADDPLLPHLLAHLDRAVSADFCVAFVQLSGVRLVEAHLRDLLSRGGRLRLLSGDYLDITDPQALRGLLDLDGNAELRVFETHGASFHPKGYIFHFSDGTATALVGSSNLSGSALQAGIEWNYRVLTSADPKGIAEVKGAFEALFQHPSTKPITNEWVREYAERRRPLTRGEIGVSEEPAEAPPGPHHIQREALTALESTRREGNTAGLVVLATGLGKTWLSAFDSSRPGFERVLFVAHREEILAQAISTFRRIRPNAVLGRYTGSEKLPEADVLFASIQTLGRQRHLRLFDRSRFDYIVVDEFHHAAAATYRNLIAHFTPKFLLGLTATPERTDGGDLLALCQENLVYRCDVNRGIQDQLLVPFLYFGVPDEVDYQNIPWRSSRFDEEELTRAVSTRKRAQNALEQFRLRAGRRTLAFCCSQRHSDFMAAYFCEMGLRAVSVHAGPNSAPRSASLDALAAGSVDVVFAVDMFNEGVDLPNIDTVMMLRPTESSILWLQQFGRGLRKAQDKSHLTVIDYIGNHRIFLNKPRTLLNLAAGDSEIDRALNLLLAEKFTLPPGCAVTYDLQAVEILRSLLRRPSAFDALRAHYLDFRERNGHRPTATEIFHEGYNPRSLRDSHGSWLLFVRAMGDLSEPQQQAVTEAGDFLTMLETTPMTKSFKMLTLLAMVNDDAFPGSIGIGELAEGFQRIAARSAILRTDVGPALNNRPELIRLIETNPIQAWIGGLGSGGRAYFSYNNRQFTSRLSLPSEVREALQELVRELAEWRLAVYLSRTEQNDDGPQSFSCKVSHSGGRPILFLPNRETHEQVPTGWTKTVVDARNYEANFAKIAVNVLREPGGEVNVLGDLLTGWFGPDAGRPGTSHSVRFEKTPEGYRMSPESTRTKPAFPELWRAYSRDEIPPLFGLKFSTAVWNAGFISVGQQAFLLVTLEKGDLLEGHKYADKFLSADRFQWQSQNRTTQVSKHGQILQQHRARGIQIHLFVRRSKKTSSKPTSFHYCGPVNFEAWQGDRPITIEWRLDTPVPERLRELFLIPGLPHSS